MLSHERLLLLEEGHCLRDQALSYCHMLTPEARDSFGASSLATIVQMVANGYGITLLPEMAIASEMHAAATSACCASARRSRSARSGLPGARPRRARRTSFSSLSCCARLRRGRGNSAQVREAR